MIDLFSGIGGFHYAAEQVWEDVECLVHCEIDDYCQKILKKHWPDVPIEPDIYRLDGSKYANVDILTGGFPCQPYSVAGQRRGAEDDRALWPEMLRVIREAKPRWVIAENVSGFLSLNGGVEFEHCLASLENAGYEVQAFVIPACAVDAPHRRDRTWIVAHAKQSTGGNYSARTGRRGSPTKQKTLSQINREAHTGNIGQVRKSLADTEKHNKRPGLCESKKKRQWRTRSTNGGDIIPNSTNARAESMCGRQDAANKIISDRNHAGREKQRVSEPTQQKFKATECGDRGSTKRRLGGMADGVSYWLDEPVGIPRVTTEQENRAARLKALGNAIVPKIVVQVMRAIRAADEY